MEDIFEKDQMGLTSLMENEVICWGEVVRLGRDGEENYMIAKLPMMQHHKVTGGENCIIFSDEGDADSVNPRLMNLLGRKIPFIVLAVDTENDRLICSRKRAQLVIKASMLQGLASGTSYEGELTGFSRYGAYIEVNGVTGHIRNSDFSEDHSDIREYLAVGDKVSVRSKEISAEGYIFWEVLSKVRRTKPIVHDFEADTVVLGRVVKIQDFSNGTGDFVNLQTGIDALCSIPRETEIEEGVRVSVKIESISAGKKPTDAPRIRGRILQVR